MLEIDLMFSDLQDVGGVEKCSIVKDKEAYVAQTEMKSISLKKYRIRGLVQGISEYVPVVFDESHFCVANVMVNSVLLDYRFRTRDFKSIV